MRLHSRIACLEVRRPPQDATNGAVWTLADWQAQSEARRNLSPAERLAVMLRDDLPRWQADRRAEIERVWRAAAETEMMLQEWGEL